MTAQEKYKKFKQLDPFPEIPSALLNSADIVDYANTTGMIDPFYDDKEYLKPATYSLKLLGDFVYWDSNGKKCDGKINTGDKFTLEKDSIAFVSLEPTIRLPYYIAARFNLKINNVYRGLLLGTGPLVDPGFEGRLSIPLHNLTTNRYTFRGGEPIIWMEFTKISPNEAWSKTSEEIKKGGTYYSFPENKKKRTLSELIDDADSQRKIRSTIPDVFSKVDRSEKRTRNISYLNFGLVIAVFSLISYLLIEMNSINNEYKDRFDQYQNELIQMRDLMFQKDQRILELENEINNLSDDS